MEERSAPSIGMSNWFPNRSQISQEESQHCSTFIRMWSELLRSRCMGIRITGYRFDKQYALNVCRSFGKQPRSSPRGRATRKLQKSLPSAFATMGPTAEYRSLSVIPGDATFKASGMAASRAYHELLMNPSSHVIQLRGTSDQLLTASWMRLEDGKNFLHEDLKQLVIQCRTWRARRA